MTEAERVRSESTASKPNNAYSCHLGSMPQEMWWLRFFILKIKTLFVLSLWLDWSSSFSQFTNFGQKEWCFWCSSSSPLATIRIFSVNLQRHIQRGQIWDQISFFWQGFFFSQEQLSFSLRILHTLSALFSGWGCVSIYVCVCCVVFILLGFPLLMICSHPRWSRLNYSAALSSLCSLLMKRDTDAL